MSFFATDTTTVTVEGVQVTLRKLTEGDRRSLFGADVEVPEYLMRVLERSVVSWSADVPVSREALEALAPESADALREAVVEFNPGAFGNPTTASDETS